MKENLTLDLSKDQFTFYLVKSELKSKQRFLFLYTEIEE